MTEETILVALKVDLQISSNALDIYLGQLIETAKELIRTEGVVIDYTLVSDCMLVEMYAAYLYRKRRGNKGDDAMPRALRWGLNNRLMQQKGAVENG